MGRNKDKKVLRAGCIKSSNTDDAAIIQAPFGKLEILATPTLVQIKFLDTDVPLRCTKQPIVRQLVRELNHYFKNPNFKFTISYQVTGTAFQKRVWNALVQLPIGKTITYGELAKQLKTGARAIGNACRANPLPLLIPCHRVLAKRGFGGFSGDRTGKKIAIKRWLLTHETSA